MDQQFSRAESEVLYWLARGLTDKEIGVKLNKSWNTVASQTKVIRKKLGFNTRTKVVAWYWQNRERKIRDAARLVVTRYHVDFPRKGMRPFMLAERIEELEKILAS